MDIRCVCVCVCVCVYDGRGHHGYQECGDSGGENLCNDTAPAYAGGTPAWDCDGDGVLDNLNDYQKILPCGLSNKKITSLKNECKKFNRIDESLKKIFIQILPKI